MYCPKHAPKYERKTYKSPDHETLPPKQKEVLDKALEASLKETTGLVPGKPCPVCGKKYRLGDAERKRRWRARRKGV